MRAAGHRGMASIHSQYRSKHTTAAAPATPRQRLVKITPGHLPLPLRPARNPINSRRSGPALRLLAEID